MECSAVFSNDTACHFQRGERQGLLADIEIKTEMKTQTLMPQEIRKFNFLENGLSQSEKDGNWSLHEKVYTVTFHL